MLAIEIMTTDVVSLKPDATVHEAAKLLLERGISGAPVIDDAGQLVGIVSEGDLLHRVELDTEKRHRSWWLDFVSANREAGEYLKSHGRKVADVMTRNVVTIAETTSLADIADLLEKRHIKRVPVVRDGYVVGLVSRANLIQALASSRERSDVALNPGDGEIRTALLGELAGRKWALPNRNIVVRDGIVHLWGYRWSNDEIEAMRVAAKGIPGVKRVEDHTVPYAPMPPL